MSRSYPRNPPRQSRPSGPWKHGPLPVVGLVGAIGAGKSVVAGLLAARGGFVLDADTVGHALLTQKPVRDEVVARFGPRILAGPDPEAAPDEPPAIDRAALGALVFAEPASLHALETIVHPRMRKTFERAIARTIRQGKASAIVLDAAILFEAGWNTLCDTVLYIDASRATRLERVAAQRGWTEETLDARERAQRPADEKRRRADVVIPNDGGLEALAVQVDRFWSTLRKPAPRPVTGSSPTRTSRGPASAGPPEPPTRS